MNSDNTPPVEAGKDLPLASRNENDNAVDENPQNNANAAADVAANADAADDPYKAIDSDPELERQFYMRMALYALQHPPAAAKTAAERKRASKQQPQQLESESPPQPSPLATPTIITPAFTWKDISEVAEETVRHPEFAAQYFKHYSQRRAGRLALEKVKDSLIAAFRQAAPRHNYQVQSSIKDSMLRLRIRSYYNTLMQGAKTRLQRMRNKGELDPAFIALLETCRKEMAQQQQQQQQGRLVLNLSSAKKTTGSGSTGTTHNKEKLKKRKASSLSSSLSSSPGSTADSNPEWRKRSRVPEFGSFPWHVMERLKEERQNKNAGLGFGTTTTTTCLIASSSDPDIIGMRTLVRIRLVAGIFRSGIRLCHETLQRLYQQALAILEQQEQQQQCNNNDDENNKDALNDVRQRLAIAWCLYAEVLWKIGALRVADDLDSETIGADEWKAYALASLSLATECPLVGNHELIAVALARILVGNLDGGTTAATTTTTTTIETIPISSENVQQALDACQDGIRRTQSLQQPKDYSPKPLQDSDYARMAKHQLYVTPLKEDPLSIESLQASFRAVQSFPKTLLPPASLSSTAHFLVPSSPGAPGVLLSEITRLHKLRARVAAREAASREQASRDQAAAALLVSAAGNASPPGTRPPATTTTPTTTVSSSPPPVPCFFNVEMTCRNCSNTFAVGEDCEEETCIKCRKEELLAWSQKRIAENEGSP